MRLSPVCITSTDLGLGVNCASLIKILQDFAYRLTRMETLQRPS